MNKRKITALNLEKELFDRGLRTKQQIHKFWKEDIEAIEYLKKLFA